MSTSPTQPTKQYSVDEINEIFLNSLLQDIRDGKDADKQYMFDVLSQNGSILLLQDTRKFFPAFKSKFEQVLKAALKQNDQYATFFDEAMVLYKLSTMLNNFPLTGIMPFQDENGKSMNQFQELALMGLEAVYVQLAQVLGQIRNDVESDALVPMYQLYIGIEEQIAVIYLARLFKPDATSNFKRAKTYLEKAVEHAKTFQELSGLSSDKIQNMIAVLYSKLGLVYKKIGDHDSVAKAIEYYRKVLEIKEKNEPLSKDDYVSCGTTHNNLGNLCLQQINSLTAPQQQEIASSDQMSEGPMILHIFDADEHRHKKKKQQKIIDLLDQAITHFNKSLEAFSKQSDNTTVDKISASDRQQLSIILMNLGYTQCKKILALKKDQVTADLLQSTLTTLESSFALVQKLMNPSDKYEAVRQMTMSRLVKGQYARLLIFLGEYHMILYTITKDIEDLEKAAGFLEQAKSQFTPEHSWWYARCQYDFAHVLRALNPSANAQEASDLLEDALKAVSSTSSDSPDYIALKSALDK